MPGKKSSSNGVVLINAAFLQEVKESFSELWETLSVLRWTCRAEIADAQQAHQWVSTLAKFRGEVSDLFSIEETFGYLELQSSKKSCVPADLDATKVRSQHAELYLRITELCELVEEAQYRGTLCRDFGELVEEFQKFDAEFRMHEQRESNLIEIGLGLTAGAAKP
jgi:hypothetical protein